jgi:hypothetical protein
VRERDREREREREERERERVTSGVSILGKLVYWLVYWVSTVVVLTVKHVNPKEDPFIYQRN